MWILYFKENPLSYISKTFQPSFIGLLRASLCEILNRLQQQSWQRLSKCLAFLAHSSLKAVQFSLIFLNIKGFSLLRSREYGYMQECWVQFGWFPILENTNFPTANSIVAWITRQRRSKDNLFGASWTRTTKLMVQLRSWPFRLFKSF